MLISTLSNCYVENKDIKFISQTPTDLKVPLLPSNCLESNCCMNRMSQEKNIVNIKNYEVAIPTNAPRL